jgi:large subunit ribosomal protein L21
MFAVIKTGGKQFRVAADETLRVGKLDAKEGEIVTFPVLMLGGDKPQIGGPMVSGATVAAEVVKTGHGRTIIAFKKRRRQNSKRKRGYRDQFTLIRITEILTDGKQPTKTARQKPAPKPKAEAKPEGDEPEAKAAPKAKAKAKAPAKAKSAAKPKEKNKGKKK